MSTTHDNTQTGLPDGVTANADGSYTVTGVDGIADGTYSWADGVLTHEYADGSGSETLDMTESEWNDWTSGKNF